MAEKNIKSRIVHKHDLESNWLLATNFVPKQGELIVYDIDDNYDYERFKIGDGVTVVSSLPFADDNKANVKHTHDSLKDGAINIRAEQNLGGIRIYKDNGSTNGAFYIRPANNTYASNESIIIENGSNAVSNGAFLQFEGSSSKNVRIGGVKTPTNDNDVANKEYVDTAISAVSTLVGDTAVSTQITNAVEPKLDKADCTWTQIYDSGAITTAVNAISGINVSGYKSLKVAIKCVNTTANSTTAGGAIVFTCENGRDYVFANILGNLIRNTASTSGGAADFKVLDNYLACECSYRALNAENMLSDTEGAGADNLTTLCGGCYIKCTSPISTMMITNATQSDSLYYGVGSRVVVWGCKI